MSFLLTVVITHFERPFELRRALNSICAQENVKTEIIVVDDCSGASYSSDIEEIQSQFQGVKFIINPVNFGVQRSRNIGIKESETEYIAFMDCDDEWLPNKIESQLNYLINESGDICSCGFYKKYGAGALQEDVSYKRYRGDPVAHLLKNAGHFQTSTLICKSSIAKNILFDEEVKKYQDWDFVIRAALRKCKILMYPCALSIFHFGAKSQMTVLPKPDLALAYISKMRPLIGDEYSNYACVRVVARMHAEIGDFKGALSLWWVVGVKYHLWDFLGLYIIARKTLRFFWDGLRLSN